MPVTKPTVTATVDETNGYISVAVSGYGSATTWTLYRVTAYADQVVRGVTAQAVAVSTVIDVDFPQGETIAYYATVTDGSTTETSDDTADVTAPDLGADVIATLGPDAVGFAVTVMSMGAATWGQRAETVTVVDRTDPVVVTDKSVLPSFPLELFVPSVEVGALLTIAMEANPVMLFSPRNPSWAFDDGKPIYVAVTGREESLYGGPSAGARIVKLTCQRVGVPLIPVCTTAPSAPWVSTA